MKPFPNKPLIFEERLKREIMKSMKYFFGLLLIKDDVINSMDALELALIKGRIYFDGRKFLGKFNKETSKILKDLGYTFIRGGWLIPDGQQPSKYLSAILQGKMREESRIKSLLETFNVIDVAKVASKADVKMIVRDLVARTIEDTNQTIMPTVKLSLEKDQLDVVTENYSKTIDKHIQGWTQDTIESLRKDMMIRVKKGQRYENFYEEIQKKFKTSPQKALFIARQETNLINAEIKSQQAQAIGITKFKWKTRNLPVGYNEGDVRPDHAELDGEIFRFDDPPIIDKKTGKRGLPGQDFNCRCFMIPVLT